MLKELGQKISGMFNEPELDADTLLAIDLENKKNEAYLINNSLTESVYPSIDRMYEGNGKQWEEKIDGVASDRLANYSKLEHNFVADTVDRWVSFVGSQPPTFMILPNSQTSVKNDIEQTETETEIEENEAEAIQKVLWNVLRSNNFRTLFLQLAYVQSKYGRIFPYVYLEKGSHYPIIELLRPHDTWPVFDSRNYKKLLYVVGRVAMDRKWMEETYGGTFDPDAMRETVGTEREKVYLYKILTDTNLYYYASNRVLLNFKHDYKKVPVFVGYNRITPFSPNGKDDIQHIFRHQKAYNATYSNIIDAVEDHVIGKRLIKKSGHGTDMAALLDRQQRHVQIGPETEISDLRPDLPINEAIAVLRLITGNIEDSTGITELLKGRFSGSIATGVALSGLSRGIQDLAMTKIQNLSEMLEEIFNFSLFLLKKYRDKDPETGISYSKIIKRDWYPINFIWDNSSIQDERLKATTNIDLVNAGIKSRMTAMKDLKMNFPEDEQSRVSYEKMNPLLNPELALQIAAQQIQKQGFDPAAEEFKAKSENSKLLRGQEVEVTETEAGQHTIHLATHKEIEKLIRGKARSAYEKHIAAHNQQAKAGATPPNSGQGGAAAPPAGGPPGMPPKGASSKAPIPGMGNEPARPMAMPGVPNPQM